MRAGLVLGSWRPQDRRAAPAPLPLGPTRIRLTRIARHTQNLQLSYLAATCADLKHMICTEGSGGYMGGDPVARADVTERDAMSLYYLGPAYPLGIRVRAHDALGSGPDVLTVTGTGGAA